MRTKYWGGICRKCKVVLDETNSVRRTRTWCRECWNARARRYPKPDEARKKYIKSRDRLRDEVVEAYGGRCGECRKQKKSKYLFLDRSGIVPPKIGVYRQLRSEGWPEGPSLVCGDCFLARRWKA